MTYQAVPTAVADVPLPGSGNDTLAQVYAAGDDATDSVLTLDATRGPFTITGLSATTASFVLSTGMAGFGVTPTTQVDISLPAVATASWVKIRSATANRHIRLGASSASALSTMYNISYSGSAYASDDATVCTWEHNVNLGATAAATSFTIAVGTAASTPTRTGVYTFAGDGTVTIAGSNQNSARVLNVTNGDGGNAAQAAIQLQSAAGDTNAAMTLAATGTGFTTAGAFVQDAAYVMSGSNLSGGLAIAAANASGGIGLYTGGTGTGNLRMSVISTGEVGIGAVPSAGNVLTVNYAAGSASAIFGANQGTAVNFQVNIQANGGGSGGGAAIIQSYASAGAGTTMGLTNAGSCFIKLTPQANAAALFGVGSFPLVFGTNTTEAMRIDATQGVTHSGAALATGATTGHFWFRTMAGTPTGAVADGAFVIDTTGVKLWARIGGAWKSIVLV